MVELNRIYRMDNLELMKQMEDGSVDLIYCDILYNTGRKFKDYDDNLGTPQQAMEWYTPRLKEMYRTLKNTGSIYLHMDHRLSAYIRVLMDNIFGYDNFRNEIVWKKGNVKGARSNSKQYGNITDHILFYSKSKLYTYNQQFKEIDLNAKNNKFKHVDEKGRIYSRDTPLGDYSEEKIKEFEKQGRIYYTKNGKPQLIRYLDEVKGIAVSNLWDDINPINQVGKERVGYDTQKPKELLKRIITSSSNSGDIVADFFCGSGTTLIVAKELGRNYIGCDINEKAVKISEERLIG